MDDTGDMGADEADRVDLASPQFSDELRVGLLGRADVDIPRRRRRIARAMAGRRSQGLHRDAQFSAELIHGRADAMHNHQRTLLRDCRQLIAGSRQVQPGAAAQFDYQKSFASHQQDRLYG